jgi:acetyltransferase EpsM
MIYFFGASGHAKVIIELAELLSLPIGGLIDKNPGIKELLNYPVSTIQPGKNSNSFVISIGNNQIRKKIAHSLNVNFSTLIHPKANVSKRASFGEGTVVMAGVSVNSSSKIGKHVILNTNCSVDHDCVVEDFVHISPNAALAGGVQVGEGSHVGIGACIIQGIKIGKWCIIGAGSVIIRDVPDHSVVVGNPGGVIKGNYKF